MHSLVRFANIAAGGRFTTADLYVPALDALGVTESKYSLASFRYDLSKLRARGLVEKIPHSRRYRLVGKGYSICVAFLKLFEKIYAPLTAGLLAPFRGDRVLAEEKRCALDPLYNTSAMIWMRSSEPSVSKSLLDGRKREQNLVAGRIMAIKGGRFHRKSLSRIRAWQLR